MSDCINNNQCKELTKLEQQIKDYIKQNSEDHKELRERITKVELTNAIQNERYDAILKELNGQNKQLDEISQRISLIESKPAKRWDGIVEKCVWAIVAAVITFILAKIGISS